MKIQAARNLKRVSFALLSVIACGSTLFVAGCSGTPLTPPAEVAPVVTAAPAVATKTPTPTPVPATPFPLGISAIEPVSGSAAGGTPLTIYGGGFTGSVSVLIGEKECASPTVISQSQIICTTTANTTGRYTVKVNLGNDVAVLADAFQYFATPVLTSLNPASATRVGGGSVTLQGSNFAAGATILFGTKYCADVVIISASLAQCKIPASSINGTVDVTIKNTNGLQAVLPNGFEYSTTASSGVPAPAIDTSPLVSSVTPDSGPLVGGSELVIKGARFALGAEVLIGNAVCSSPTTLSQTQIRCTVPAASRTGSVSVQVSNADGTIGVLSDAYVYNANPTISSLSPAHGVTAGGTALTIRGSGFRAGATVSIGGNACTSLQIAAADTIRCISPAGSAGSSTVIITNSDASTATFTNAFTYDAMPTIASISPASVIQSGGKWILLSGSGFQGGATILIGSDICFNPLIVSSTEAHCLLPASGTTGAKDVKIINPDAGSATLTNGLTFNAIPVAPPGAPVVVDLTPRFGSPAGGTAITISGQGFLAGDSVSIGSASCTGVTVSSATQIQCTTPAGSAGSAPVTVRHADGTISSIIMEFYYAHAPKLTSMTPTVVNLAGGDRLTILGTYLMTGATVTISGQPCTGVTLTSTQALQCTTPALAVGPKTVVVTNPDTQSVSWTNALNYQATAPTITSVSPSNGPATGGTTITVTGTGFVTGLTAQLDNRSCGSVNFGSATNFTCVTPALAGGSAPTLSVTNPDNQTASYLQSFTFNTAPAIASVVPTRGPATGGTALSIQGSGFLPGSTVTIGGTTCASVVVASASLIRCVTPAHAAGNHPIVITLPDTQSTTLTNGFLFDGAPTIIGATPATGSLAGGNTILIAGTGFQSGILVKIGGTLCSAIEFQSSTSAACVVPRGVAIAAVAIDVTNPDNQTATLAAGYRYTPVALALSCSPVNGDYNAVLSTKPCTETNPESGTLSWAISGCATVTINSATGTVGGTIPAGSCTATVTLTNTNALIGLSENLSQTVTISPYLSLAWDPVNLPSLSAQCVVTVPGISTLSGGSTWSAGAGSNLAKAAITTGSSTGLTGTLTDYNLGNFAVTWAGQSTGPSGTALSLNKNLQLTTAIPTQLAARTPSANYFSTQAMGSEIPRSGCGATCDRNHYGSITVGGNHVCAIADNGIRCWGRGDLGQTAANANPAAPVTSPTLVYQSADALSSGIPTIGGGYFTSLAASLDNIPAGRFFCGILADKTVACWGGTNNYGQLGSGDTTVRWQPSRVVGLTKVKQISSLATGFCALKEDGTVWCWGAGGSGRLGDNNNLNRSSPVRVSNLSNVSKISASSWTHNCALSNGQIWCWGNNNYGQLGSQAGADAWEPILVPNITNAIDVSVSFETTCAALADGSVKCWGRGTEGETGDNTNANRTTPVTVIGAGIANIVEVAGNVETHCARSSSGQVWCWGYNTYGNVGDGTTTQRALATRVLNFGPDVSKPAATKLINGQYGFCAITDAANNYSLWCWGWQGNSAGTYSQHGLSTTGTVATPTFVMSNVQDAITRLYYYFDGATYWYFGAGAAIQRDGSISTWGAHEADFNNGYPQPARASTNLQVAAGLNSTCAVLSVGGRLRCWGSNQFGELAVADNTNRNVPTANANLAYAVAADMGDHHLCYVTSATAPGGSAQKVMCSGRNTFGQLGDSTSTNRTSPVVAGLGAELALSVATGGNHTCAVTDFAGVNKVRCWGKNSSGQVGNNSNVDAWSPQIVLKNDGNTLADAVRMLAAGGDHTCALLSDSSVMCWGDNTLGQLGDGTIVSKNKAVAVTGLTNVVAITAGNAHTCAITKEMQVKCWGSNVDGTLGDGSTYANKPFSATPVQVKLTDGSNLSRVVAIDAGQQTNCVLVEEANEGSSIRCWGSGSWGQMGNGTTTQSNPNPVTVTTPGGVVWTRQRDCRNYSVTVP